MAFRKAERRKAKLRLGIAGPAGSGKTASALLIAYGITGDWAKIGLVDTENGSGELYVGSTIGGVKIGEYNVAPVTAPYTPKKYIDAISEGEQAGLEVIIIDSLTHAWAGEGGLLDQQAAATAASRSGNSYMAWREITPLHNRLVESLLTSKCHIIATMRTKTEYALSDDNGKKTPNKIGTAPIQRDGMEYEFTVFMDITPAHIASASKDRTNLFDGERFKPSPETGARLLEWLETGVDAAEAADPKPVPVAPVSQPKPAPQQQGNTERRPSEGQIKRLFAIAHEHGIDDATLKKAALDLFNKTSTKDLTIDEYNRFVAWIEQPSKLT